MADVLATGELHATCVGNLFLHDNAKERGFSLAVGPHQGYAGAVRSEKRKVFEQEALSEAKGNVGQTDHGIAPIEKYLKRRPGSWAMEPGENSKALVTAFPRSVKMGRGIMSFRGGKVDGAKLHRSRGPRERVPRRGGGIEVRGSEVLGGVKEMGSGGLPFRQGRRKISSRRIFAPLIGFREARKGESPWDMMSRSVG
ncbi:MAG: hypothetical protein BWY88_00276 [Synergistetes bacterium ADurb.Bin520]|nr:MAG: hypothetical protein BWY88_00276 [Synergistetes bacterium ADurb.Bin520]